MAKADVAVALFVGQQHVCEAVNPAFGSLYPGFDVLGLPVREAFTEPDYAPLFRLMDDALRTGQERWARFRGCLWGALPRMVDGEWGGVAMAIHPAGLPAVWPVLGRQTEHAR